MGSHDMFYQCCSLLHTCVFLIRLCKSACSLRLVRLCMCALRPAQKVFDHGFYCFSFFSPCVSLPPFCHGNPACIVTPLWVCVLSAFFYTLVAGCHRQAVGSSQASQGRAPLRWVLQRALLVTRHRWYWSETSTKHFKHTPIQVCFRAPW